MNCSNDIAKQLLGHKVQDVNIESYTIYDLKDLRDLFDQYNPYKKLKI